MSYTRVYPNRISWQNYPSVQTPLDEINLNKMDYALSKIDETLVDWDITKANQTDLLTSLKTVDYDTTTGVFIFTWWNGTTKTIDLDIEKIPVSFSMSPQGVITMTTSDGTTYTADVSSLIKIYTFNDSDTIDFTVTTDASGNKTVIAIVKDGSITESKLQPNFLAEVKQEVIKAEAAEQAAETAQGLAEDAAEDAEAWAEGSRGGIPVGNTDPTYQHNSKYWADKAEEYAEQSVHTTFASLTDVDMTGVQNGNVPVYNSSLQKYVPGQGGGGGGATELNELDDVSITSPTSGQVLTIRNGEWTNEDPQAGDSIIYLTKAEYDALTPVENQLYGITDWSPEAEEIIDDTTTSISKTWSSSKISTELSGKANTSSLATVATSGSYADLSNKPTIPTALSQLTDDTTHRLVTDTEKTTWSGKASTTDVSNTYKVTSKTVATTGWTSTTTAQSGVTLYKKTIALSHVYVTSPIVDIGASGVLPTVAQQEAYDLLQYVTINGTTLTLYSSAIPSTAYYINITGVD